MNWCMEHRNEFQNVFESLLTMLQSDEALEFKYRLQGSMIEWLQRIRQILSLQESQQILSDTSEPSSVTETFFRSIAPDPRKEDSDIDIGKLCDWLKENSVEEAALESESFSEFLKYVSFRIDGSGQVRVFLRDLRSELDFVARVPQPSSGDHSAEPEPVADADPTSDERDKDRINKH